MSQHAYQLRQLWFEWPESRFGRFNFQREEHLEAFTAGLLDDQAPAVVVLAGERGIGRGYLCEAAADRARGRGREVGVWHLRLDGFEPEAENPLDQFLKHLIEEQELRAGERRAKLRDAVKAAAKSLTTTSLLGQASEVAAALVSLVWQFEAPLERFIDLLRQPGQGGGVPPRDDPGTLSRFLNELTSSGHKLLIHVDDGPQLTSYLRRLLLREAERAPQRLLLAISCPPEVSKRAAPEARHDPLRLDLTELDSTGLRQLVNRCMAPNELPDQLVDALLRRTRGRPAAIANLVADLVEAEAITCDTSGVWRLPPAGMTDERMVETFSRGLYEEVDERLTAAENAGILFDVLYDAALCDRYVPLAAILARLELDETAAEEVVDWIDDVLVDELEWLVDMGFGHPAFPGRNVYAFIHPLLPRVVLDQLPEGERVQRAVVLLRFFEQSIRVQKRGMARMLLSIAEHLDDRDQEQYTRWLEWWAGREAADAIRDEVRTAIEHEQVDPELVWSVVKESKDWLAYRRLALLDAYSQALVGEDGDEMSVLPFDRLRAFHLLRAELLIGVGRYGEALADAQRVLPLVEQQGLEHGRALNLCSCARLLLGRAKEAQGDFEEDLDISTRILGPDHPNTLTTLNNLALTLSAQGEHDRARQLEEQVLEASRRLLGPDHPDTLKTQNNLAVTLWQQGKYGRARQLQEQVLEARRRLLGPDHPGTLKTQNNLAATLRAQGEHDRARQLEEQVLETRRRLLGPEHPDTLKAQANLATMLEHSEGISDGQPDSEEGCESSDAVT